MKAVVARITATLLFIGALHHCSALTVARRAAPVLSRPGSTTHENAARQEASLLTRDPMAQSGHDQGQDQSHGQGQDDDSSGQGEVSDRDQSQEDLLAQEEQKIPALNREWNSVYDEIEDNARELRDLRKKPWAEMSEDEQDQLEAAQSKEKSLEDKENSLVEQFEQVRAEIERLEAAGHGQ